MLFQEIFNFLEIAIQGSYLFSTIAKKVAAYSKENPEVEIIRLGIGDVTQPIVPAVIEALHGAVDEMGAKETFRGYAPDSDHTAKDICDYPLLEIGKLPRKPLKEFKKCFNVRGHSDVVLVFISPQRYNILYHCSDIGGGELVLYHGSDHIIQRPEARLGKTTNDYGRGFYCTEYVELAKEWACQKATDGFANKYEFDMSGLKVCNLGKEPYHILNWLALLTRYRSYWQAQSIAEEAKDYLQEQFFVDLADVDVVIGYRADDSYFSFAQDFISGTISLEQLSRAMRLGKLGEQIVIKSERAFERLMFQDAEVADAEEYYTKKIIRDREARQAYRNDIKKHSKVNETLITDIMRGTVSIDELRI